MIKYWCCANIPPRPLVDLYNRAIGRKKERTDRRRFFCFFCLFDVFGPDRFGPDWCGPDRFGSVRFGSVRTGSVLTGSVRSGSKVLCFFFQWGKHTAREREGEKKTVR
jgi:hypothetical protein